MKGRKSKNKNLLLSFSFFLSSFKIHLLGSRSQVSVHYRRSSCTTLPLLMEFTKCCSEQCIQHNYEAFSIMNVGAGFWNMFFTKLFQMYIQLQYVNLDWSQTGHVITIPFDKTFLSLELTRVGQTYNLIHGLLASDV